MNRSPMNLKPLSAGLAVWTFLAAAVFGQAGREVKWLRTGSLHQYLINWGAEIELGRTGQVSEQTDGLRWPAQFPYQDVLVAKSMWIGCTNYSDRNDSTYANKVIVIGSGVGTNTRPSA